MAGKSNCLDGDESSEPAIIPFSTDGVKSSSREEKPIKGHDGRDL